MKMATLLSRELNLKGNIEKAQIVSGVDDELLAIRLGISRRTLARRKKQPGSFTVVELLTIADVTKTDFEKLFGE